MTFDSKTLNAEERALWDAIAIQERRNRRVASESYSETEGAFRDLLKARRALFGEPASGGKVEKPYFCGWCRSPLSDNETHLRRILNPGGVGGGYAEYTCQAASAPAKVECPNCGAGGNHYLGMFNSGTQIVYSCDPKPAQPEPAANSAQAINARAEAAFVEATRLKPVADGRNLVTAETHPDLFPWVKPHAQMRDEAVAEATKAEPVAAEMPEAVSVNTWQLEELLKYADLAEVSLRTGFHPPEFLFEPADRSLRQCIDAIKEQRDQWHTHAAQPAPAVAMTPALEILIQTCESWVEDISNYDDDSQARPVQDAIAAVRSQAAEAGKVRMLQVRIALDTMRAHFEPDCQGGCQFPMVWDICRAALAELDAAEGRK